MNKQSLQGLFWPTVFLLAVSSFCEQLKTSSNIDSILSNGREIKSGSELNSILKLDIISAFNLNDEYDTDLKKKMFKQTEEYKEHLKDLSEQKKKVLESVYFMNIGSNLGEYDIKKGRFKLDVGDNTYSIESIRQRPSKSIQGVYLPTLPTFFESFMGSKEIKNEYLPIKMPENKASEVEGKENLDVFLIFKPLKVISINYSCYDLERRGEVTIRGDFPTTQDYRIVVKNNQDGNIYFDKAYK